MAILFVTLPGLTYKSSGPLLVDRIKVSATLRGRKTSIYAFDSGTEKLDKTTAHPELEITKFKTTSNSNNQFPGEYINTISPYIENETDDNPDQGLSQEQCLCAVLHDGYIGSNVVFTVELYTRSDWKEIEDGSPKYQLPKVDSEHTPEYVLLETKTIVYNPFVSLSNTLQVIPADKQKELTQNEFQYDEYIPKFLTEGQEVYKYETSIPLYILPIKADSTEELPMVTTIRGAVVKAQQKCHQQWLDVNSMVKNQTGATRAYIMPFKCSDELNTNNLLIYCSGRSYGDVDGERTRQRFTATYCMGAEIPIPGQIIGTIPIATAPPEDKSALEEWESTFKTNKDNWVNNYKLNLEDIKDFNYYSNNKNNYISFNLKFVEGGSQKDNNPPYTFHYNTNSLISADSTYNGYVTFCAGGRPTHFRDLIWALYQNQDYAFFGTHWDESWFTNTYDKAFTEGNLSEGVEYIEKLCKDTTNVVISDLEEAVNEYTLKLNSKRDLKLKDMTLYASSVKGVNYVTFIDTVMGKNRLDGLLNNALTDQRLAKYKNVNLKTGTASVDFSGSVVVSELDYYIDPTPQQLIPYFQVLASNDAAEMFSFPLDPEAVVAKRISIDESNKLTKSLFSDKLKWVEETNSFNTDAGLQSIYQFSKGKEEKNTDSSEKEINNVVSITKDTITIKGEQLAEYTGCNTTHKYVFKYTQASIDNDGFSFESNSIPVYILFYDTNAWRFISAQKGEGKTPSVVISKPKNKTLLLGGFGVFEIIDSTITDGTELDHATVNNLSLRHCVAAYENVKLFEHMEEGDVKTHKAIYLPSAEYFCTGFYKINNDTVLDPESIQWVYDSMEKKNTYMAVALNKQIYKY